MSTGKSRSAKQILTHILTHLLFLVHFSVRENLLVVTGSSETKEIKDYMPNILNQVGPKQYKYLKEMVEGLGKSAGATAGADDDEDDVPPLVQGTFEDASKQ